MTPQDQRPLWVPVRQGVRQELDSTARTVDVPLALDDVQFLKDGKVGPRKGFWRLGTQVEEGVGVTPTDLGSARAIFSTGGDDAELCVVGNRFLHAYAPGHERWMRRGPVSPFTLRQYPLFTEDASYDSMDMAENNGYIVYFAKRAYHENGSDWTEMAQCIEHESGTRMRTVRHTAANSTPTDKYHAVRCCKGGNGMLYAFAMQETDTSPSALAYWRWNTKTPSDALMTGPAALSLGAGGIYFLGEDDRTYDVIGEEDGNVLLAHVDNSRDIILREYSSSATGLSAGDTYTLTTNDPYVHVAIAEDPTNDQFLVLTTTPSTSGDPSSNGDVRLYGIDRDLGAGTINFNLVLRTLTGGLSQAQQAVDLGVVYDAENDLAVCTWTLLDNSSDYTTDTALETRSVNAAAGTGYNSVDTAHNMRAISKPWVEDGHSYVAAATTVGIKYFSESFFTLFGAAANVSPWDSNVVVDLRATVSGTRHPYVVGAYDVGTAVRVPPVKGSGNSVVLMPNTREYRFMSESSGAELKNLQDAPSGMEMRCDFDGAITTSQVLSGAVAIGGGLLSWYDGDACYELGHVVPPVIYASAESAAGGSMADGTWQYLPMWAYTDKRNLVHRSMPGPPAEQDTTGGGSNQIVTLSVRTNPVTNRVENERVNCVWHRSDDTAVYKRISRFSTSNPNRSTAVNTDDFIDNNYAGGPAIYTQGGELEAVCPGGAAIVKTVNGRLWLGDMVRQFIVAYSKPPDPGVAGAYGLAPEFNEGFVIDIERERRVTGLAALDDKLLVFTSGAVYAVAGAGPLDNGAENDFSDLTLINGNIGCIEPRSVVEFPDGVMFQSEAGIYMVDRSLGIDFVGAAVEDDTTTWPVITGTAHDRANQLIVFSLLSSDGTEGALAVFDYETRAWMRWNPRNADGTRVAPVGCCMHRGQLYLVEADGQVWQQQLGNHLDDRVGWVGGSVNFAAIFPGDPGGWGRIVRYTPVIELQEPGETVGIKATFTRDGSQDPSIEITPAEVAEFEGKKVPVELRPHRQKCHSMELLMEATPGVDATTGAGYALSGVLVHVRPRATAARVQDGQRG